MQQGKELLFEQQTEIHIGRTTDNDVVLQDAGVSRKHVRISDRLGRYYVQDLGSSNGTLVNDKPLSGEQELQNGDRIALGPVEFLFKEFVSADDATRPFMPVEEDDATRPIRRNLYPLSRAETDDGMEAPMSDLSPVGAEHEPTVPLRPETRSPAPPVLRPAPGAASQEAFFRADTVGEMAAVEPPPPKAPLARPEPRAPVAPPRPEPRAPAPVKAAPAPAAAAARASSGASGSSAADLARRRRELSHTLGGQLKLWWLEMPRGGKAALLTVATCFLVGMVGALVAVFRPQVDSGPSGPEPRALGLQALSDSFGLGEGVTWEQPDMKAFDFEFVSPTRAVAVLSYQASGISKEEVSLSVNATAVGWVPPDTTSSTERELQQILPPSVLNRNERNQLVFDNVRNPPGEDSWRVWNLRLEIIPVPDMPPEELLETARGYVAKARNFYERKDIGAENLTLAWENYRSAWITLEALDEKPDLYQDVRHMLGQVAVDLDHKCGQLMLDFQRNIQFKDRKRAARVLDEINRRFPTPAHRCHNLAAEKASEYGL
ncbi:FHA domain-containing protein [Archangium violaceum]|uniref:FHA domain-containing protein n=1 Tax=Archangium violaceum TaxID=83451 RepID=UPI002B28F6F8|nr:FHA domain-containing protein [Archangium violaceum]